MPLAEDDDMVKTVGSEPINRRLSNQDLPALGRRVLFLLCSPLLDARSMTCG